MAVTELSLIGGLRLRVDGDARTIEAALLSAARGSLMELAWLVEADSRQQVAVNPDHVVMLRPVDPSLDG